MLVIVLCKNGSIDRWYQESQIIEQPDGSLWFKDKRGDLPFLISSDVHTREKLKQLVINKEFDKIPAECFVRYGENSKNVWMGLEKHWNNHPWKIMADKEKIKQTSIFLSSRGWGDYSPVVWNGDITRDMDEIFVECKHALQGAFDIDSPNQTDEEIINKINTAKSKFEEEKKRLAEKEQKQKELEKLRKKATMTTTTHQVVDEGGKTIQAKHRVTLENGQTFSFSDRNIFDVGRIINPDYEIVPGKHGGLFEKGKWESYEEESGWIEIRSLAKAEKEAYDYVVNFGYYSNNYVNYPPAKDG
jgi:uncharacterized protein YxjI